MKAMPNVELQISNEIEITNIKVLTLNYFHLTFGLLTLARRRQDFRL
jgi:hypothetical protein